jgi:hypothetical protein
VTKRMMSAVMPSGRGCDVLVIYLEIHRFHVYV